MCWQSLKKWEVVKGVEKLGTVEVILNFLKSVGIVGGFLNCKMIVGYWNKKQEAIPNVFEFLVVPRILQSKLLKAKTCKKVMEQDSTLT